jgi:hypothetical protein
MASFFVGAVDCIRRFFLHGKIYNQHEVHDYLDKRERDTRQQFDSANSLFRYNVVNLV